MFSTGDVLCEERDPFQPPLIITPCLNSDNTKTEWQLQGTLLQKNKQAASMNHPRQGHYLLLPGQSLPGTLWQIEQVERRRVVLRHASACLLPEWVITLKAGSFYGN